MKRTAILVAMLVCAGTAFAAQKSGNKAAEVNGEAVTKSDVDSRLRSLFGARILNDLINDRLIRQEATKLGVKVTDAEVDQIFARVKGQGAQADTFKANLESQGVSEATFRTQLRARALAEAVAIKKFDIKVTDTDAETFFKENKTKMDKPEGVSMIQISAPSRQEAQDVLTAVKAGADFKNLAIAKCSANKLCPPDAATVTIFKGQTPAEIEKQLFVVPVGQYSEIVEGANIFNVFKAVATVPAKPAEYSELKEQIRAAILQTKLGQAVPDMVKNLRTAAKITTY